MKLNFPLSHSVSSLGYKEKLEKINHKRRAQRTGSCARVFQTNRTHTIHLEREIDLL